VLKLKTWVQTKKGNQFEILLPAKRVVCPACDGTGIELRGGLKGAVLGEEQLGDPDFMESYMGGDYDTACSECKGKNVVLELDWDSLTAKMQDRVNRAIDEQRAYEAERAMERRLGC